MAMYMYFPDNYPWSMAAMMAVNLGGTMSDLDEACASVRELAAANDDRANDAWFDNWTRIAERAERQAGEAESAGHMLSAQRMYRRAAAYYMTAERMAKSADPKRIATYRKMKDMFRKGVECGGDPVEWVKVPYKDTHLNALFVPAPAGAVKGGGPAPCMIHFDGLDVMKEFLYLGGLADAWNARGISALLIDHPGVGEALREQELTLFPEVEQPAAAAVDYLEGRVDVDSGRIGIQAISLGGYYAPRAAGFEPRLKCCIAWGAIWDYGEITEGRLKGGSSQLSVSHWAEHMMWVFGQKNMDDVLAVCKRMTLEEAVPNIRCPLLVVHGEGDRQIPLKMAENTVNAAVNSPRAELKVFTRDDGGIEHCQVDNPAPAVDYMADWAAEVLDAR